MERKCLILGAELSSETSPRGTESRVLGGLSKIGTIVKLFSILESPLEFFPPVRRPEDSPFGRNGRNLGNSPMAVPKGGLRG